MAASLLGSNSSARWNSSAACEYGSPCPSASSACPSDSSCWLSPPAASTNMICQRGSTASTAGGSPDDEGCFDESEGLSEEPPTWVPTASFTWGTKKYAAPAP